MSRTSGPIPIFLLATSAIAAGCLGDVPPFSGSGGASSSASTAEVSGSATTGTASASSTSGGDGGEGGASVASSSGIGGDPAGSVSASSSSSGAGGCGLDQLPETCGEAYIALECAALGAPEECPSDGCPFDACGYPVASFLQNPSEGFCSTALDSVDPPCLLCDGAGPAIALATTAEPGPLSIATFPPGMPSVAHLVARGQGAFQLAWRVDAETGSESAIFALTSEFTTYELPLTTSSSFELRILPSSPALENVPLWMEIDCVYTLDTASTALAP